MLSRKPKPSERDHAHQGGADGNRRQGVGAEDVEPDRENEEERPDELGDEDAPGFGAHDSVVLAQRFLEKSALAGLFR